MLQSLAALLLAATPVPAPPGDGIALAPSPPPEVRPADLLPPPGFLRGDPPAGKAGSHGSGNWPPLGGGGPLTAMFAAMVGAAMAIHQKRRFRGIPAPGAVPPGMKVVFVPGHGSGWRDHFDGLIGHLGLTDEQAYFFDWRSAVPGVSDHRTASERATASDAAAALQIMIESIREPGDQIYLVGFSKGGAAIAHLIADWDRDPDLIRPDVVGVTLLDTPMADGLHGLLQSIGLLHGSLPDDGGYDPMRRGWPGFLFHEDSRERLGERSGVEVVAIRNPDSLIANFGDHPEGLRIYDLDDGGPDLREAGIGGFLPRIVEAHHSVLWSPLVADCIRAEMWQAGACALPEDPDEVRGAW
jgi:hypothetical protein